MYNFYRRYCLNKCSFHDGTLDVLSHKHNNENQKIQYKTTDSGIVSKIHFYSYPRLKENVDTRSYLLECFFSRSWLRIQPIKYFLHLGTEESTMQFVVNPMLLCEIWFLIISFTFYFQLPASSFNRFRIYQVVPTIYFNIGSSFLLYRSKNSTLLLLSKHDLFILIFLDRKRNELDT